MSQIRRRHRPALIALALLGAGCNGREAEVGSAGPAPGGADAGAAAKPTPPGPASPAPGPRAPASPAPPPPVARLTPAGPGVHNETAIMPGSGTALRYAISVPEGLDPNSPAPLVVALHYGGDVTPFYGRGMIDDLAGPAFEGLGAVIVAPDALGGGDWTTPQNEEAVTWLTRSVLASYPIDPRRVLLTGYSMGGQGTWYIGGRHQDLFTAAMPVSGEPGGAAEGWKVPIYVIHSRADEILPLGPTESFVARLKASGADVTLRVLDRPTHYETGKFAAPMKDAVPWLRKAWR